MPANHSLALIVFAVSLLAGCGSKLSHDNFDEIETGMSESEVFAILGEPDDTSRLQLGDLSGTAAVWEDETTRITIQFLNNEVRIKQFTRSEDDPVEG